MRPNKNSQIDLKLDNRVHQTSGKTHRPSVCHLSPTSFVFWLSIILSLSSPLLSYPFPSWSTLPLYLTHRHALRLSRPWGWKAERSLKSRSSIDGNFERTRTFDLRPEPLFTLAQLSDCLPHAAQITGVSREIWESWQVWSVIWFSIFF